MFAGGHSTGSHPGSVKIEGLPGCGYSETFTIEAKADGSPGQPMMLGPMLQTVLENRFALKIHSENHDEPAYALTAAKSGLKVRPFLGGCTPENPFRADLGGAGAPGGKDTCPRTLQDWPMNLDVFAWWISGLPRVDAPVINNTGINGYFRFNFKTFQTFNYPPFPPDQVMDSVRAALEDIGLKLVAAKAPRRHLVIDHVKKPSAN